MGNSTITAVDVNDKIIIIDVEKLKGYDRVKNARKNTKDVLKDMRERGASREERTASMAAGARTEQVLRDLDRGVVRGFEEGGLVEEKQVKEVVKGLKKASKLHAKQADTLEKTMKAKKKKSK